MTRRRFLIPLLLACLIIPTMGAAQVGIATVGPRDLTEHDQALADVQAKATEWSDTVAASDQARASYEAALDALNTALDAESTARGAYETAQQAYADAYAAVEKEDKLRP